MFVVFLFLKQEGFDDMTLRKKLQPRSVVLNGTTRQTAG